MTPFQFRILREEYLKERREQLEREAHWVAVLVNLAGHPKHAVKVHDLIGFTAEQIAEMRKEHARRKKKSEEAQRRDRARAHGQQDHR